MNMSDANNDPLSSALNMNPLQKAEPVSQIIAKAHDDSATTDFSYARGNIYGVIEKGIAQVGMELSCPKEQLVAATQITCVYPSPSMISPTAIAAAGLCMVQDIIQFLEEQFKCLEDCGALSLGLNDLIAAHANGIEDFVYLLKQRVNVEMENGL